ncbi:hypothetical protein RBY4I_2206 [Rhodobacterales bacterium Y4I]|nr:hypothetical protein RBY4I_2206 [Rhodobacterales bacterium Y4I]
MTVKRASSAVPSLPARIFSPAADFPLAAGGRSPYFTAHRMAARA